VTDVLADRYGRRPDGRRFPLALVVGLVVGVPFLIWVAWVWWTYSTPAVQSTDRNFTIVDAHLVRADIEVTLRDDARHPSCRIQAIAEDKTAVGSLQFTPVDGANHVEIPTERQATAIELVGCTADGQNHPR
jgi:hypothetical protein